MTVRALSPAGSSRRPCGAFFLSHAACLESAEPHEAHARQRMRLFSWLLRALLFFVLFAFALNNQEPVTVHWFFGVSWTTPMVIVVLISFALGAALGVLAMVPAWWRGWRSVKREAKRQRLSDEAVQRVDRQRSEAGLDAAKGNPTSDLPHPPRDGL